MTSDYLINPSAAQLVEIIQSKVEFPQNWSNLRNKLNGCDINRLEILDERWKDLLKGGGGNSGQ